eukprot:Sspe_Gene.45360::Locus_22430_Transcript_1_1_Confidence_1.000_Length_1188::g.45360::m.45360
MSRNTRRLPLRAILFDMDGVLAEVKDSYRAAIMQTCTHFGVSITHEDIAEEKRKGNANNDWALTQRMINDRRTTPVSFPDVKAKFEELYQGTPSTPGLCTKETLIPARDVLEELHRKCNGKLAIVTGRPRTDCMTFLRNHNLEKYFTVATCMDDGPPKPDPFPVTLACSQLGVDPAETAMIGDTPDDILAAVRAGCGYPVGVLLPDTYASLQGRDPKSVPIVAAMVAAGASHIFSPGFRELLDLIPSRSSL